MEVETLLIDHPGGGRGGGDRHARREVGRAAAGLRGAGRGRGRLARRPARAPVVGPGELAAARRLRLHRRGAQDERRASSTRRSCAGSWPRASWRSSAPSATRSASRTRQREEVAHRRGATRPGGRRSRRSTARRRPRARRRARATRATARPTRGRGRARARRARPRRARRATVQIAPTRGGRVRCSAHIQNAHHTWIGVGSIHGSSAISAKAICLAVGQRVVGGQRDVARLARELVQLERGGEGRAHDGDVGLAGEQPRVGVGEGEVADVERDVGVALGRRRRSSARRGGQAGGRAQADGEAGRRRRRRAGGRWRRRGRWRPAPRAPAGGSPRPPRSSAPGAWCARRAGRRRAPRAAPRPRSAPAGRR